VHNRGVALITAILVVALATTVAVAMMSALQLDIRRSANLLGHDQALLYAQGVEDWAAQVLRRDRKDSASDTLHEEWATVLPPIPVEGGQLQGRVEDLSGRLNINDLLLSPSADGQLTVNLVVKERFRRLCLALSLDPDLMTAVIDWLDADLDPAFPGGAEDIQYLAREQPYRAANWSMSSPSELMLVEGFDREIYQALLPYVATLPRGAKLNVNTAAAPVLMSLAENLSDGDAESIIAQRGEDGFASIADFLKLDQLAGRTIENQGLGLVSDYFMVSSNIQVGDIYLPFTALFYRNELGICKTIYRAQGT
jgi:general secretion pathway protein K